jgi:cytochrome c oxidase subunit 4
MTHTTHHVEPKKVYLRVFAALMVFTVVTVWASTVDLGPLNIVVALVIAVCKALLVVLFFMHVRYSRPLTQIVVAGGFLWLIILLVLTLSDYFSRGWLPAPAGW